jgi:hypothetical protein
LSKKVVDVGDGSYSLESASLVNMVRQTDFAKLVQGKCNIAVSTSKKFGLLS